MNTVILVLVSVFLALIGLFLFRASKGVKRDITQLKRPIQDLQDRGLNQGVLVITHSKYNQFIQFRKYKDKESEGIIFGFPFVKWSQQYYPDVKELCLKEEIGFLERNNGGTKFLEIDFNSDVNKAYDFSVKVFSKVFNFQSKDKYFVALEGASK